MKNKVLLGLGIVLMLGSAAILLFAQSKGWPTSVSSYLFFPLWLGWMLLCHALGDIFGKRAAKKHPETARRVAIEQEDERNIAIANKAKAKAYDSMLYAYSALVVLLAVMGVGIVPVLLLLTGYLSVVGLNIYWLNRYRKED